MQKVLKLALTAHFPSEAEAQGLAAVLSGSRQVRV